MKTLHLRNTKDMSKGQRVITIVSEFDQDKMIIRYAFSVCSKHDTFVKKFGRDVALERFKRIGMDPPEHRRKGEIDYFKFSSAFKYNGPIDEYWIKFRIEEEVEALIDIDKNGFRYPEQAKELLDAYRQCAKDHLTELYGVQFEDEETEVVELSFWNKVKLHLYKFYYLPFGA